MHFVFKLLVFAFVGTAVLGSKLNLPRVLLPLFKSSSTNFTLKVTDNGCYTWTLSRLDIIQLIPVNLNKQLDCSSEVILSTITKEFIRNTVIVLVEEVTTKEVLRCDVIVDVISSLHIVTKTRQLFVEESPEIFEVRAYDDQGNEFSTLEGVQFIWTVSSGSPYDISSKNDVLRFMNFKDSLYEIPPTILDLDSQGLKGHIVLLEGVKTGTANVTVELSQHEYRSVPPATVQLNVIANLLIEPSDSYILQGDVIYYKLLQVKNGRFMEVPLPSNQYSLIIEDETVARQLRPWVVEALKVGQTKLILSDVNSKMSNVRENTYLPSVMLNVVIPAYMNLVPMPYKSWVTVLYQPNTLIAEMYDSNNHKIHIGPYTHIKIKIDKGFKITDTTKNGSCVDGYAVEVGVSHVLAEFNSVRNNKNDVIQFTPLRAEADLLVYDPLSINPPEIRIPWDPRESPKLVYPLIAQGGDGFYQWTIADSQIAIVTQTGNVKPRSIGRTEVTVSLPKNQALQATAKVLVQLPSKLTIVRNSVEAEVGSPVFLAVALYYAVESNGIRKHVLFSNCSGFPFEVKIHNFDFYYNATSYENTPLDACTTIGIIGRIPSTSAVTISYIYDGNILKDTATVSAFKPLKVLNPESSKTVLSVGAQRYIVFTGGPSLNSGVHRIATNNDDKVISVKQIYDVNENERVFLVTCQTLGKGFISLQAINSVKFEKLVTSPVHQVDVICTHPKSLSLSTEVLDTKLDACPDIFHSKNVVLNNKLILMKVILKDEDGNVFDNATSLDVKWTLSSEDLGEILHQGVIKLEEENRYIYKLPLFHYQIISPNSKTGDLTVTAKILNYKKSWFKRLSIDWEDKNFNLQQTLTLTLVNNLRISPEFVSLFNHPQNTAKFQITHGSGFYNVSSSAGNAATINYSEISKSVEVVPRLPGTFRLTVKDECLNSEPVHAEILILTVSQIDVDVLDKIEKGKSVKAYLTLIDSEGNIITKKDLLNLKVEIDSNAIYVNCDGTERNNRISCTVSGIELGHVNLIFTSGIGDSLIHSKPIRIQVYPPLKISPGNVTLIPGASLQLIAKGGPQPDCVIEYFVQKNVITVDNAGNVHGKELGEGFVEGRAVGVKTNGEKIVYSTDIIKVFVILLEGIQIKTPLTTIKSNGKMPIWVSGIPEQISPLVLASVQPTLSYKWSVSSPDVARISHIFEDTGVKITDEDRVSMRFRSLKAGNVVVFVNVTIPRVSRQVYDRKILIDSINIKVFDELKISSYDYAPLLLPPNTEYNLRTNKDKASLISFENDFPSCKRNTAFDISNKGGIKTTNIFGFGCVKIASVEEGDIAQNAVLCIEVSPVKYMMLNVVPKLQVDQETSIFGLPRGVKLLFKITYHDTFGKEFVAVKSDIKVQLNKIDKVRVSEHGDNNLVVDLLDYGVTVMKVHDQEMSLLPDFMKINAVPYIQPDKVKLVVGDIICFNTPPITKDDYLCIWNSSNDNALTINKQNGFAVAKSEQNNVIISYQCSNDLKLVTTADIYALHKVEILPSKVTSITNNEKRYVLPLRLINKLDDLDSSEDNQKITKNCVQENQSFYPYECEIKFVDESIPTDVNSVFKVYSNFDANNGHSCVIESLNMNSPALSKVDSDIVLKVSWGRYHSTSKQIPFKPALFLDTVKLIITNEKTTDYIRIVGLQNALDSLQLTASNSKFIAVKEEFTDAKSTAKFAVYLKPAYLKNSNCPSTELSVTLISETTGQNIKIPISVNINADQYSTPSDLTDDISLFVGDYSFRIVLSLVIGLIIYLTVLKLYKKLYDTPKDESMHCFDISHNRSHLSNQSSPGFYRHSRPSYNEIQKIYRKSPEMISRNW